MLRFIVAFLLVSLPATHLVNAESGERELRDMPVYVFYCDDDPGRIQAGGGMGPAPEELLESGLCRPAEGVAVTFLVAVDEWDFEEDELADEIAWDVQDDAWFDRCDIDGTGRCMLNSPVGFDIVLGVVLHESTVVPGYTPAFFQQGTHNFSEFAGWGLALIPDGEHVSSDAAVADHQTLALNITDNGEPGIVLTEWEINDAQNDLFLATSEGGWVSNIVGVGDDITINLVNIDDDAMTAIVCGANDDASVSIESRVDDNGNLHITVPETESDIRCDVTISG